MPATHQAVFAEMISDGTADKAFTTKNPEDTDLFFWKFTQSKYLPFSMEPVDWDASASQAKFGASNVKYEFPRQGDLCWHTYAKVFLPGLAGVYKDADGQTRVLKGEAAPHWHNAIGQRVLSNVTFSIGGIQIISVDDTYMYLQEEVSGKPGKRLGEAIGKFDTVKEQQTWARRGHWCYVPLPLPFNQSAGNALALCALTFHKLFLEANFASRSKCVILPHGAPSGVQICVRPDGVKDADIESGKVTLEPLNDNHLKCLFEATFVYLENAERDLFTQNVFEQCITEVQQTSTQASFHGSMAGESTPPVKVKVPLPFSNIVQQYLWVVRTQASEDENKHYSFGGYIDGEEDDAPWQLDPFKEATIKYANAPRVGWKPAEYWRLVQPHYFASNAESMERKFVYMWSFSVDPEGDQPAGGCNHSRVDDINMELNLDARIFSPTSPTAEVIVWGVSKNLLRYNGNGTVLRRFS
jgi:hypothetical protein